VTASGAGVLVLRLWVGLNFVFSHGLAKARDPELFLSGEGVQAFPMPELLGWVAIASELGGGALLALGLFTRTSAAFLLLTMLGAAFVVHGGDPWIKQEFALTYAVLLFFLLMHGPGDPSLDGWLARRRRRRSPW
jgi:putative oxidoreductase